MRASPTNIQPIGSELAIKWSDGSESFFALETLRKNCPCAGCGGEPDVLGRVVKPEVTHTPASFRLRSVQMVGGYAIQPTWEDGHNSGIYSYEFLKRLETAAAAQPKP